MGSNILMLPIFIDIFCGSDGIQFFWRVPPYTHLLRRLNIVRATFGWFILSQSTLNSLGKKTSSVRFLDFWPKDHEKIIFYEFEVKILNFSNTIGIHHHVWNFDLL